jgi:hypothetical protein
MNSNELTRRVMQIVSDYIEPMVTEHMKEHPEYFHNCSHGSGKISNFDITLSYQPESLSAVMDISVPSLTCVSINNTELGHELVKYGNKASMISNWWIKGDTHTVRTV